MERVLFVLLIFVTTILTVQADDLVSQLIAIGLSAIKLLAADVM